MTSKRRLDAFEVLAEQVLNDRQSSVDLIETLKATATRRGDEPIRLIAERRLKEKGP